MLEHINFQISKFQDSEKKFEREINDVLSSLYENKVLSDKPFQAGPLKYLVFKKSKNTVSRMNGF